jgi:hypothetical protein
MARRRTVNQTAKAALTTGDRADAIEMLLAFDHALDEIGKLTARVVLNGTLNPTQGAYLNAAWTALDGLRRVCQEHVAALQQTEAVSTSSPAVGGVH